MLPQRFSPFSSFQKLRVSAHIWRDPVLSDDQRILFADIASGIDLGLMDELFESGKARGTFVPENAPAEEKELVETVEHANTERV